MLSELPQCISNSLETKRSTINMGFLEDKKKQLREELEPVK
jgi:hypothetical protein